MHETRLLVFIAVIIFYTINVLVAYRNLLNSFSSSFKVIGIDEYEHIARGYPGGILWKYNVNTIP